MSRNREVLRKSLALAAEGRLGSAIGNRLGFVTADAGSYHLYVVDVGIDGRLGLPRRILSRPRLLIGPVFSHDGAIAVLAAAPSSGGLRYELMALDTSNG